jgi:hypothetical protein
VDNIFKIGTSLAGLIDIEALDTPLLPPHQGYSDSARNVDLASGHVRGMGFPVITWHWGFLEADEFAQLRTFCPGKSANIFIQSPNDDDEDTVYLAVMIWPAGDSIESGKHIDFTLDFRHCVEQEA